MARISKYENTRTEKSITLATQLNRIATQISIEEIENLQMKYGISDGQLADFLEIQRSIISLWKSGKRGLPKYYLINIFLLFKYLDDKMEK
jgi:DNA-binding transcriptional regulator YiaG